MKKIQFLGFVLSAFLLGCGGGGGGGGGGGFAFLLPMAPAGNGTDPSVSTDPPAPAPADGEQPSSNPETDIEPLCPVNPPAKIAIVTSNASAIEKENYISAGVHLDAWETEPEQDFSTQIRGRGNSTWLAPKKPYRLKLEKKDARSLLAMPKDRNWTLLANYYDKSLIRNAVALCLGSKILRKSWTPRFQFAELTLNGSYEGLYQLTEQVSVGADRVNLGDTTASTIEDSAGAFLVEFDQRLIDDPTYVETDPHFTTGASHGYTIKSDLPDENDAAYGSQFAGITAYMEAVESQLMNGNIEDSSLIDEDALIDMYLLNEFLKNNDGFFVASTYFHRSLGGRLIAGPPWDFDLSQGLAADPLRYGAQGWWTAQSSFFLQPLLNPGVQAKVAQRWHEIRPLVPQLLAYMDRLSVSIADATARNLERWPASDDGWTYSDPDVALEAGAQKAYIKNWIVERAQWMDAQLNLPAESAE